MQKKEPCALVIDRYRAHLTKKVKKLAKKLQIELIFVPTNGTSEFQPLDSWIFGILKSKLLSLAWSKTCSGKTRYEMILKDNLESAWNIQDLEKLI